MSDEPQHGFLPLLQSLINKAARIECSDGEVFVAEILFVDLEERDVIYELVSTNRPRENMRRAAYCCKLADIVKVEADLG